MTELPREAGLTESRSEEKRREIYRTRSEIARDIHELEDRLAPENIRRRIQESARARLESIRCLAKSGIDQLQKNSGEWKRQAGRYAAQRPLMTAALAAGLGWLVVRRLRRKSAPPAQKPIKPAFAPPDK